MLFFLERNYSLNRVLYQIVLEILLNLDIFHDIHQDKQLRFESTKSTDAAILAEHKKKEREAAKHGKRPFYLKNCNVIVLFCFLSLSPPILALFNVLGLLAYGYFMVHNYKLKCCFMVHSYKLKC